MPNKFLPFCGLFLFFLIASAQSTTDFSLPSSNSFNTETFLAVDEAYQTDIIPSNHNEQISVLWHIQPKHYLYHHGFKIEWLNASSQGLLDKKTLQADNGLKKDDPYFGEVIVYYNGVTLDLPLALNDEPLYLKAVSQGCADAGLCYPPYSVYFSIQPDGSYQTIDKVAFDAQKAPADLTTESAKQPGISLITLLTILLGAFLGGLILNLMPCVLPILGLKAFQLTQQNTGSHKKEGLAYMLGVVLSFTLIAAVMIGLRSAGDQVGWGFQLQNSWFIISLVYLFFILGLSLSGFFHIGANLMGAGQGLTEKGGTKGSFFTGVLAVIVASPCTAPFMGGALGFAATQPPSIALLVFVFLGLGMALPLTLISFIPKLRNCLPKPGAWMERLKEFFAFPLYLTGIWLLWVLGKQAGMDAMIIAVAGCVFIALSIWLYQHFKSVGKSFALLSLAVVLLSILYIPFQQNVAKNPAHVDFTPSSLTALRNQGQGVFVDITADWCITCKANEVTTLNTKTIQQAFKDANIVYMIADWTNKNAEITTFLNQHGRNGVPLYLFYPPTPNSEPIILPQILTKSIVLKAIALTTSESPK